MNHLKCTRSPKRRVSRTHGHPVLKIELSSLHTHIWKVWGCGVIMICIESCTE
ncbi:Glycine dehydrogenase (decarboxylating) [Clarias magur]|uniref:Glycine dehydrogenase (Decarboxylating) n=1 Tax=Clarias magur TaxID=1594786 RepID=A0A8J4U9M1_CLAMG|nr:Glycine dehydrogenase (decarboxylating) [Clarias magur]